MLNEDVTLRQHARSRPYLTMAVSSRVDNTITRNDGSPQDRP